jgi:hypothetical protein
MKLLWQYWPHHNTFGKYSGRFCHTIIHRETTVANFATSQSIGKVWWFILPHHNSLGSMVAYFAKPKSDMKNIASFFATR